MAKVHDKNGDAGTECYTIGDTGAEENHLYSCKNGPLNGAYLELKATSGTFFICKLTVHAEESEYIMGRLRTFCSFRHGQRGSRGHGSGPQIDS